MLMKPSYASQRNSRFLDEGDHVVDLDTRWNTTFNQAPLWTQNHWINWINDAKLEFNLRNPLVKHWNDLKLAKAEKLPIASIRIDATMQRYLEIDWVLEILTKFRATKVVPIQVYKDKDSGHYHAWDGQHTLVMLWLMCTHIFGLDPEKTLIPVNIFDPDLKNEIRDNYISLNGGDGKHAMDTFDIIEQMIYAVRVDGSQNPKWKAMELKQRSIEKYGFFLTAKKFGDHNVIGAISRLNEIENLDVKPVDWLLHYLALVCQNNRIAEPKELLMIGNFFQNCYSAKINVDDSYISELAKLALNLWKADFSPFGVFWSKANTAYVNWHRAFHNSETQTAPKFRSELIHGMPFLVAQLGKSKFSKQIPPNTSNSEFWPKVEDLF